MVAATPPSLVLHNVRLRTMSDRDTVADAIAMAGDRILAVGRSGEILRLERRDASVIDCRGLTLIPGFIDAHCHLLAQAGSAGTVDCSGRSMEMIVSLLAERARSLPSGAWVVGRGYHEANLKGSERLDRQVLDSAICDRPVRVVHSSGHATILNSAALELVGVSAATEAPAGGHIDRDPSTGEPAGLLLEMEDWLASRLPRLSDAELETQMSELSERLLSAGVTSVQDLGHRNDAGRGRLFAGLIARGAFRPRLTLATGYGAFARGEAASGAGIEAGPVKIMINETGDRLHPGPRELAGMVAAVHDAGRQVAIHAVEQRSISAALDAIELAQAADERIGRHRIEHASITPTLLAERIASLGVVIVTNPAFIWEHGDRYLRTVSAHELPHLYDLEGLRQAGICVAAGSDCPVAPPEPATGIMAAQGRRSRTGRRIPGRCATFNDALASFTSSAAFAAFEEQEKGRIEEGLLADLVLVREDDRGIQPVMTILGGSIAWQSDASPAALQSTLNVR